MKRVSCIIPAYNEAPRIANVLDAVRNHPLVSEILVIDDGSTDGTREIIDAADGVMLIPLPQNGGKSAAVAEGIRLATGDLIFLLDADLTGITPESITALIQPVVDGAADMSISLRGNTPLPWRMIGLDYISGERVFSKAFIAPLLGGLSSLHGFGLEVYLNRHLIKQRGRIAVVWWPRVASAFKHTEGQAWYHFGIKKDFIRMAFLVLKTIPPWEAAWQVVQMLRLKISLPKTANTPVPV
jgi:glycosyltransferase involved in cell wall biosynthesis